MGIHQALFALLGGVSGITSIVGANPKGIYPDEAPAKPGQRYVVYFRVGKERNELGGASSLVKRSRFQFNCYGGTADDARALGDLVEDALDRAEGTYASVVIQDTYVENRLEGVDDDAKLKVSMVDVDIVYEEA
jgi:hypothetical protein